MIRKRIQAVTAQPDASADAARISLYYPAGVALGRKLRNQKYESQHSG